MRFNLSIAVSTTLLLLAVNPQALAQGRGPAYHVPTDDLERIERIGYREGYEGKPSYWQAYGTNNNVAHVYNFGYSEGQKKRQQVEDKARHQELLGLYGSEENVKHFERGFLAATNGHEATPPEKEDPSGYIAYIEGYHQGKRGTNEPPGKSAHPDDALPLTKLYVEQLNAMRYESERYYVLLEIVNKRFELAGGKIPTVAESLERSEFALKVAKELYETHMRLHQHAWAASQLNPRLVAALNASATRLLLDKEANEFPTLQKDLHANADQMATQARKIAAEPVTVPNDFEKLGRFHRASIAVIGRTVEVDRVRLTIASGGSNPEAMLLGIEEYTKFCKSWQSGHLNEWRKSRLPRMYGALGTKPPGDATKQAEEDVERFLLQVGGGGR